MNSFILITAIALNSSLTGSLSKIEKQKDDPALFLSMPATFMGKESFFLPFFAIAVLNQIALFIICFLYYNWLLAIIAYLGGIFVASMVDRIDPRVRWLGIYLYPIPVVVLTTLAFSRIP